jgi:hypothetical protein
MLEASPIDTQSHLREPPAFSAKPRKVYASKQRLTSQPTHTTVEIARLMKVWKAERIWLVPI